MASFSPDSIPNRFDFAETQAPIYREWESRGCFHAEPSQESAADPTRLDQYNAQ
jgi:hypothetical protein